MAKRIKKLIGAEDIDFYDTFDWGLYLDAEKFLQAEIKKFLRQNSFAKRLAQDISENTSTRFFDWVDHMVIPEGKIDIVELKNLGFEGVIAATPHGEEAYKHPKAVFFPILIAKSDNYELALKPEYLDDFIKRLQRKIPVEGKKDLPYRRAAVHEEKGYILAAVERRGTSGFLAGEDLQDIDAYKKALQLFVKRKRRFEDDSEGLLEVERLIKEVTKTLSPSRAADAFFRAERSYWERKNKAGRHQRIRHDLFGLGWGNHDHHTFRSSRKNFVHLIRILEHMGFLCRERFFPGEKAGWGAQVLEHPDCGITVFADVDITEDEKGADFSHKGLAEIKDLRTVGLWIALHGESILQSGIHHMAARFNFTQLKRDLMRADIDVMKPFSDFPFLKQAFTVGEIWKVEKRRIDLLLKKGMLSPEQYKRFRDKGAIGSHLENIQRRQGFKGFNQDSVTAIIHAIDPRGQKT